MKSYFKLVLGLIAATFVTSLLVSFRDNSLVPSQFRTNRAPAPTRTAWLYSVGDPPTLVLDGLEKFARYTGNLDSEQFTISMNCRKIIATSSDSHDPSVLVIDVNTGQQQRFNNSFFGLPQVYEYLSPSVSSDGRTFAVTGLSPGSVKTLFLVVQEHAEAVYTWLEDDVTGVRWSTPETVILELSPDQGKTHHYIQVGLSRFVSTPDIYYYRKYAPSQFIVFDHQPEDAIKTLSCHTLTQEVIK